MFELTRVLCPVDFSERSHAAARYAAALAAHFHADLHLIHVVEPRTPMGSMDLGPPLVADLLELERENAQRCICDVLRERRNVRRAVLEGDPAQQIVEYANHHEIHLIVMPTHGYGPFRRFIMGSVTAKVLHDAQCPVLTGVHVDGGPCEESFAMLQLVCALDLGPDSERVLRWADRFARTFGSKLMAVHVTRQEEDEEVVPGEPGRVRGLQAVMERVLSDAGAFGGVRIEVGDDVAGSVCHVAKDLDANLTIIGRSGFGSSHGRLRSDSYAIIRQSPCPVISV